MNQFTLGLHTVVLLVGPSQSGKSTWADIFCQKIKAQNSHFRVSILSSDSIRHELLGENLDKYDPKMLEASEAAFDLLFSRLDSHTRFPINNEFVVVDTTGLDSDFRLKVSETARKNGYRIAVVLFDYQTGEYFAHAKDSFSRSIISKHVDSFKQRVLPVIKRKSFDYSYTVRGQDKDYFENLDIEIVDKSLWEKSYFFDSFNKPMAIIGDIHESIHALKNLVAKIPQDSQLVFLGDLFDKGQDTLNMLEFALELQEQGAIFVVGNHESFVARRLLGKIEPLSNEKELFPSLSVFQENPQAAEKFLNLYKDMLPFAVFKNYGKTIYVTHAPCHNQFLGKLSDKAQKLQRNFYFSSRESQNMINDLRFVENEAKSSHPIHVFGHIAHAMKHMEMKNKIWLDSGAVYGRKLSALIVDNQGNRKIISVNSEKRYEGKLLVWKKEEVKVNNEIQTEQVIKPSIIYSQDNEPKQIEKTEVDFASLVKKYHLESEDIYWLKDFAQSGAKFIAGTMAPARSTETQLESLEDALSYFKKNGVDKVIIEPKWMGSRLQVYLHRDTTQDFAITRSGHRIRHEAIMSVIFKQLHERFDSVIDYKEQLVLDGEIMPWSAIGKELIDKEFVSYGVSIQEEFELLSQDKTFADFGYQAQTEKDKKGIQTFMEQLTIFSQETIPEYKPFNILMIDNELYVHKNQEEIYSQISQDPYCVIDLFNEGQYSIAEAFFDKKVSPEGVVIKPVIYKEGIAPYIKVRQEDYLHLIYGFDYQSKYAQMCKDKKTGKKLSISIKEFELGLKMLTSISNTDLIEYACQMKFEMQQEKELDPRL